MDQVDYKIFKLLQKDSRISISKLSQLVNLSRPSVQDRVKKMVDEKIITGFTITSKPQNIGYSIVFFMTISELKIPYDNLLKLLKEMTNIIEINCVTGKVNYIVKAAMSDIESMNLLLAKLRKFSQVETMIILDEIQSNTILDPIMNDNKY